MPKKENEIVLDKMALEKILNTDFNRAKSVGIKTVEDFLNREISLYSLYVQQPSIKMDDFKLVGICDNGTPSVYMDEDIFINVLASSTKGDPYSSYIVLGSAEKNNSLSHQIYDIELAKDKIELTLTLFIFLSGYPLAIATINPLIGSAARRAYSISVLAFLPFKGLWARIAL